MLRVDEELLSQVTEIAYLAADKIIEVYNREDFNIQEKSDNSPLTEADLAAHSVISDRLSHLSSAVPILSEESEAVSYEERQKWRQYWLVDPLDGTKEFIAHNPEFTVNIALIEDGLPVMGVVLVPPTGLCYAGGATLGARKKTDREDEWQLIKGRPFLPQEAFTIVASRRHGADALDGLLGQLQTHFGTYTLENIGSALKICLCADGTADLYPRLAPTCEWDTAAAQAVVEAAGGSIIDDKGQPLRYNQKESLLNPFFFALADGQFSWQDYLV